MPDNWKKVVCTIPNLLSLFRLLLIPVYLNLYLRARQPGDYYLAGAILSVSCLTDLADGMIARELNMVSQVGKVLDPLADKLTQFFLLLSLSQTHPLLRPMLMLFVAKELFQLGAMLVFARKGKALCGALPAGKLCTACLFVSLTALVKDTQDLIPEEFLEYEQLDEQVANLGNQCYWIYRHQGLINCFH